MRSIRDVLNFVRNDNIKVVSFDVFDTLLCRPVVKPTDLFKVVGYRIEMPTSFISMRIEAEKKARRIRPVDFDDITLDEIYECIVNDYGISKDTAEKLKLEEISVEKQYLKPRKSIKRVYDAALTAGKDVVICSDMYLPENIIRDLLEINGFIGFSGLYISSSLRISKGSGRLYSKLIEDYKKKGIYSSQILHIGDNEYADYKKALQCGLKAIHIMKPIEMLNNTKLRLLLGWQKRDFDCNFIIGGLANYLFDDPFINLEKDSLFDGKAKNLGSTVFGPMLLEMIIWMIRDVNRKGVEQLCFIWRDGYLPLRIFNHVKKYLECNSEVKRIYLSRNMRYPYCLTSSKTLYESFYNYRPDPKMTIEKFVNNRMLISNGDKKELILNKFLDSQYAGTNSAIGTQNQYLPIVANFLKDVKMFANRRVEIDRKYINSVIDFDKSIGFWDVGYRGSPSIHIKKYYDTNTVCYHLFGYDLADRFDGSDIEIKYFIKLDRGNREKTIIAHLTEDLLSDTESSVKYVSEINGKLVFERESIELTDNSKRIISDVQDGAFGYVVYILDILQKDIKYFHYSNTLFYNCLLNYLHHPCLIDAKILHGMNFCDSSFVSSNNNINVYDKFVRKAVDIHTNNQINELVGQKRIINKGVNQYLYSIFEEYIRLNKALIYLAFDRERFIRRLNVWFNKSRNPFKKYMRKIYEKLNVFKNSGDYYKSLKIPSLKDIDSKFSQFRNMLNAHRDADFVFIGPFVGFDKGTCEYINHITNLIDKKRVVIVNEAVHLSQEKIYLRTICNCITVPELLGKDKILTNGSVEISKNISDVISSKTYLKNAIDNLCLRHRDIDISYAKLIAYYCYIVSNDIVDILSPKKIVLWNKFYAFHCILDELCKERGVSVLYWEFGVLPGTFSLDKKGQMGESWPSIDNVQFKRLPVNNKSLSDSRHILSYLRRTRLNRNPQPIKSCFNDYVKMIKKGRPVIFYAGQNDYESGLQPYTENSKIYHSPVFKTSLEALKYLDDLAEKNDWNLIYKPHPINERMGNETYELLERCIVVNNVDINEVIDFADMTITILSQVAYLSLIREKCLLIMGYTQLRESGCCYEAYEYNTIESTIKEALSCGFTEKMRDNFELHVAQLIKYYLYDDMTDKKYNIGRTVNKFCDLLLEENKLEDNIRLNKKSIIAQI